MQCAWRTHHQCDPAFHEQWGPLEHRTADILKNACQRSENIGDGLALSAIWACIDCFLKQLLRNSDGILPLLASPFRTYGSGISSGFYIVPSPEQISYSVQSYRTRRQRFSAHERLTFISSIEGVPEIQCRSDIYRHPLCPDDHIQSYKRCVVTEIPAMILGHRGAQVPRGSYATPLVMSRMVATDAQRPSDIFSDYDGDDQDFGNVEPPVYSDDDSDDDLDSDDYQDFGNAGEEDEHDGLIEATTRNHAREVGNIMQNYEIIFLSDYYPAYLPH